MDAVNDPGVETVVVMSSAQIGKTEMLLCVLGYFIDYDPSPILLLQPTLEMAQTFSKDRLAPMLRDTPALHGKVSDSKARSSGNTMLHKTFPGGHITMAGANSPASLASRPIRIVMCDEIDRYPVSAGAEGDPVSLARKRTATFWNRKIVLVSTPTVKGASRIEAAYEDSTQEVWQMPCPSCGEYQQILHRHIVHHNGDDGNLIGVDAACEHCGAVHGEQEWKRGPGRWHARAEHHNTRGFHLNEYVSQWRRWIEIERDFLAAKSSPEQLKTWVNTSMGETWEEEGEQINDDDLFHRREKYPAQVPAGALVLVAGVDVQDDRLEAEIVGYGDGEESWGIERRVIWGDPSLPDVWEELDQMLLQTFTHERGAQMHVAATCVDSGGHHTQMVYAFCRERKARRVFAVKGVGGQGRPIVSAPRKTRTGQTVTAADLFTIGVDEAKRLIYSRLKIHEPGPGYCHFPDTYDQEFFAQLTAEKLVTRYRKGFPVPEWIKTRPRNEALDIRVYALAALKILNPVWQALAARFQPQADDDEEQLPPRRRKLRRRQTVRRGGFVQRWR